MRAAGRPARRHAWSVSASGRGWLRIVIATELAAAVVLRRGWRIVTGSARSSWSICRCSAARPGWCGASSAGVARRAGGRGPSRTREIASSRCAMTTRAARWATVQVGRHGRTVAEVAADLGCDWHTVMDAVVVYGTPLIDDPRPLRGRRRAVGLDETLFAREGPFRTPAVVDPDRRRRPRPAARRRRRSRQRRAVPLVRRPARGVAGRDRLGDAGSVGVVSDGVRHDAPRRRPGRRPVPRRAASPTRRWMSAAGGCRTRPSAIGAASPIRSTGPGGCSTMAAERLPDRPPRTARRAARRRRPQAAR